MEYLAVAGGLFLAWLVFVFLFSPAIDYHLQSRLTVDSPDFLYTVQSTCQAALHHGNRIEVFTGGDRFYPAMLDAIAGAARSITMECYIFQPGDVAGRFVEALAERAENGVEVKLVVDAIGSARFVGAPLERLRDAGVRVESYRGLTWHGLARLNNRTHRELLVVDGRTAFIGGAGVADWWSSAGSSDAPAWRDTMARVHGPVVAALQGVFAENWLECCGEILVGDEYFPSLSSAGETTAFVVKSSPADRATASRVVFQLLIEGACQHLRITTPYFLPDRSLRRALTAAAARGVRIRIVVPGYRTDQRWVRLASRRLYGELLEAGIEIHEYRHSMLHAKMLVVDTLWSVLGTTNIDNRSFEHNDEVNIAMLDPATALRLVEDFEADAARSQLVTLERWRQRPLWERVVGPIIWILERQQ